MSDESPISPRPDQIDIEPPGPAGEVSTQTVHEGPPTHVLWREESYEIVYPEGHDPASIEELPADFWDVPMIGDPVTQTFSPDLAAVQQAKWDEVKSIREYYETAGAPTPYGVADTDPVSQQKVSAIALMAHLAIASGQPFTVNFTRADNQVVTLDGPAALAMALATGRYVGIIYTIGQGLRDEIYALGVTAQQVQAIDVPTRFATILALAAQGIVGG